MKEKQDDIVISLSSEDILAMRVSYNPLFQKLKERSMDLHSLCIEVGLTPDMEDLIRHHEMVSITAMGKLRAYFSCQMFDLIELLYPEDTEYEFQDVP